MMEWSPEMHRDLQHFKEDATIEVRDDYSLIALQRPGTVDTLGKRNVCVGEFVGPGIYEGLCTNITCNATLKRVDVVLNQCGYTGEDGMDSSCGFLCHVEQCA